MSRSQSERADVVVDFPIVLLAGRFRSPFNLNNELLTKWSEGQIKDRWQELVQKLFPEQFAASCIRSYSGKSVRGILLSLISNSSRPNIKNLYEALVKMELMQEAEELLSAVLEHLDATKVP